MASIVDRLERERSSLLLLNLRNPLLNYRPRARGLEATGESPPQLFRVLVREGRRLSFLPAPSRKPTEGLGQPEEEGPSRPAANQDDLKIQTDLPSDQLQARLLATYHAARTSLEEQGVTTLFLALGMLSWMDEGGGRTLRAPLILVPVMLERSGARERFHLRQAEEEPGLNLSLAEKLRTSFGLVLPEPSEAEDLDVVAYFDAIAAAVAGREGWTVDREAVALGFFSFGKFLMYRDLDEDAWPEGARPGEHPVLGSLLGDGFRDPGAAEAPTEDAQRFTVLDADGSQALALADAAAGRTLVIQGPPGTGKSQTIANLIAGAIGRGRSVLFVAEKMAALEVVKRRLDGAGLGAACLELHSHKTSKKAVLDELRRTLDLAGPPPAPAEDDERLLREARERLDGYCEAIGKPVGASGVTPQQAIGEVLRLRAGRPDEPPPPMDVPAMDGWAALDFRRALALVEQLQARVAAVGVARDHPFRGSRRATFLPADGDAIRAALAAATRESSRARAAAGQLARTLGLDAPADPASGEALLRASRCVAKAAQGQGADLSRADWLTRRAEVQEALDAGTALAAIHERLDETLAPTAWDQDLRETRQALDTDGRRWWRLLSGRYRKAKARMAAITRVDPPRAIDAQLALIDEVHEAARRREALRARESLAAGLFGERWQGERSNWPALANLAKWATQLHLDVRKGRLPEAVLAIVGQPPPSPRMAGSAKAAEDALAARRESFRKLADLLEFDAPARFGEGATLEEVPFDEADALLATWSARLEELPRLVALNQLAGQCREVGLGPVAEAALEWPEAGRRLADAFRLRWFERLLSLAFRERPALARFDGRGHESVRREFRDLDRRALLHNRARLAMEHRRGLPRHEGGGQLAVLRREFEKKTRHLPVRQLLERAGHAVRAIKPVFLMSPMSVAAYLSPDAPRFDLVVFDEASQVRPADALGALLRAGQAVVVGDEKQLPPTSFFDRLTGGADDDIEDDAPGEVESLLGLFSAQGAPRRLLRWHYRSRHESLIAVSNREFYDGRLVVLPSPDADRREAGLVLRHLPDTAYDRGKTRTNAGEADAVARAVMDHARAQGSAPRLTLGVAAFSVPQVDLIRDRLEALRREDPSCEAFFATGQAEPFFVKNLENVQGDERDVIFISVGYGRTADGELALNFGPLNAEGGERRLNVLITRARLRCEVFTNLTPEDIDTDRARSRGVRALKTFLAFARDGATDAPEAGAAIEAGTPFDEAVAAALAASGQQARRKVGPPSSAIDFAVLDPDRPGHYLLGIEGDGPPYYDARPARDRDRLRPQVLEGLGWRLHRAWSADWLRDPAGERERLLAAIEGAKTPAPAPPPPAIEPVPEVVPPAEELVPPAPGIAAYRLAAPALEPADGEFSSLPPGRLPGWVVEVVEFEGPVHVSEVARRIAEAAGGRRLGPRVQALIEQAADEATRLGTIARRGEFLWPIAMVEPEIRNRGALPAASRRLELVAPEEVALAVEKVVADAFGMEPAAVPAAACRLLGFPRLNDDMRTRVEAIVADLVDRGRLALQGGFLVHRDLRVAG